MTERNFIYSYEREQNERNIIIKKLQKATGHKIRYVLHLYDAGLSDEGYEVRFGVFWKLYCDLGAWPERRNGSLMVYREKDVQLARKFREALEKEGFKVTILRHWKEIVKNGCVQEEKK